jgi:hypothetical protein
VDGQFLVGSQTETKGLNHLAIFRNWNIADHLATESRSEKNLNAALFFEDYNNTIVKLPLCCKFSNIGS